MIRFSATPREADLSAVVDRSAAIPISVADRFVVVDHSADSISVPRIWVQTEVQTEVDSVVQSVVPTEVQILARSAVVQSVVDPIAADPSGVGVRTR